MAKKKKKPSGGKKRKPIAAAIVTVGLSAHEFKHMVDVKERAAEADQLYDAADEIAARASELMSQARELQGEAAGKREEAKNLEQTVRRMLREGPGQPTLFDKNERPKSAKPKAPETLRLWPENEIAGKIGPKETPPAAPPKVNDDWRAASLTILQPIGQKNATLTKAIKALIKYGIATVGQLEDQRAKSLNGNWFEGIPSLGREGVDVVEDRLIAYLSKTRDVEALGKAQEAADQKAQRDGGASLAASLLPWREGVARQIETEHAFGPKVSAAMLRKALSKTSREVAEIDAYWICDKKGVHVEKFQGQPIDLEQRTISYADLAELIKGLPKAEAATSQESPAADAPTEAKAAKFGDVPDDWKQRIAAKLQERQKYFEPPTVKELRADVGVPGSVSDQDVSVVFLSDAIKCNHVAGVDCDLSLPWKEAADLLKVIIESKTKPGDRPAA